MSKFHLRIKELRISRKLSQQELADCLKISKSSINMYERGEREPGLNLLEAIADFFNVDMDYLLGKSDNPQKYISNPANTVTLTTDEKTLVDTYRSFNDDGKERLLDIVSDMAQLDRYNKNTMNDKTISIYRAARSQDNAEHEIIKDGKSTIDKLSQIPPVTDKEDF